MSRRTLRLGLFVYRLGIGGAERQILELAEGLGRRGHQVHLFTVDPEAPLASGHRTTYQQECLWHGPLATPGQRIRGLIEAPCRLAQALQARKIEVVYSFLYRSGTIAALASRRAGCPWVHGIRTTQPPLSGKRAFFFRTCAALSTRAALLIANSREGLQAHLQAGFRGNDAVVVANGFDLSLLRPSREAGRRMRQQLGLREQDFVVGRVARFSPVKDHRTLFLGVAKAAGAWPNTKLLLVGDGTIRRKRELAALASRLGLSDRTVWAGPQADVVPFYNAMDLCVSTSLNEGFPNVVGEAMACARVNVVTDVGASRAMVGNLGWVIPAGDDAALCEAIAEARVSDLEELGAMARRRVARHFNLELMLNQTESGLVWVVERFHDGR